MMKLNKGYRFRAYEVEGVQSHEKEQPQVQVVAPKPSTQPRKHPQKDAAWQVEAFLDSKKAHGITMRGILGARPKCQGVATSASAAHVTGGGSATLPLFDSPPDCQTPPSKAQRKKKTRRRWFARKEKLPEVSPLESGATTLPDILAPASSDFRHRDYVVVDGVYHSYLYITGYGYTSAVTSGWLNTLVEIGEGINLSFVTRRQQKDKILPKIAQTTMVNRSRMRDVGDTRQDYEELDSAIMSGLWMKDEMNRNGEHFYYMHTLIEVTAADADTLEQRVAMVETRCTSLNMVAKRCDYKHEQGFLSSLPLLQLDPDIERKSRRNALTTGVAAAFPFSSFEICDQTGIMLGINLHNRSVCMLDIFDSAKYSNANISICGMSGAGKTMLLQTMAVRLREQNTQVFIIAPLKGFEFRPACEAIGGRYIKLSPASGDCINIMEIRRSTLDVDAEIGRLSERADSLLADKIAKLHIYFSLLKPNITDEERHHLDATLVECYQASGLPLTMTACMRRRAA